MYSIYFRTLSHKTCAKALNTYQSSKQHTQICIVQSHCHYCINYQKYNFRATQPINTTKSKKRQTPLAHSESILVFTSIMDSPTIGIVYRPHIRQPLSPLSTVVLTMMNGTTSDPVQCELRADAKELLWIGNASLFSWHPCSYTRNRVYRAMGWYRPILRCVPRQQGGGDAHVDLSLGAASSIIWLTHRATDRYCANHT